MHGDKSRQNYHQRRPPTTVASEASIHRQKMTSLRSSFLAQASNPPKDVPYIDSSASSTSNIHSFPSDELPPRLLAPITPSEGTNNGFPTFPYRLPNSSIQPGSYSPSLPTLNPPSVPRRIARRSGRITSSSFNNTSSTFNQLNDSPISTPLLQPKISEPHMPSCRYTSPPYNDLSYPTIVYETLTNVREPQANYSQPSFRNSAMFYHKSVVEPPSVITLSPSEPLCLYAARQGELCRSCQKLALSWNSSFHRSSSRHSTKRDSSGEESVGTRQKRRRNKLHGSLPTGYRSVNDLKRRSFRRRTLNYSSSSSSGSSSPSINLPEEIDDYLSSDEFWPIAVSQPRNRVCRRRRTRSLNPRARRRQRKFLMMSNSSVDPPADYEDDREEEARAVDALAMRLQPMLAEGRTAEVQTILLKALTCPEMRQRALSLLDYLTSEGAIFSVQNRQQAQPSHNSDAPQADIIMGTTTDVSSDLSQNFASRLKLSGAVDTARDEDEDETKSSDLLGEGRPDKNDTEAGVNVASLNDVDNGTGNANATPTPTVGVEHVKVLLPPGGLVEPPPPRLAMPPPKPFPPPTPRSAVVPPPEELARIDEHALKMLNVNPLLITDLVSQLTKDCKSDVEIVRRLFRWVTTKNFDAVEYDPSAPNDSFVGMLRNVQAGSLSRNELFHELCRFAGIYCQYISGYSKGAGYRPGMSLKQGSLFRNTWLVVFVADGWRFVNCNWAARYATSTWSSLSSGLPDTSPPKCDDFYFFTDPEQHIFEHWPDNKVWQLLQAKPVSQTRFVSLPVLKSAFFNAGLSLKKPYSQKLVTKNGQVSIKLRMPYFIGISCSLENCADGSFLRGFSLAEVLIKPPDMVRVHCAPSQPGRYYLNIYVSPDWRRDDIRELVCSFQVQCCEFNYPRLVVMGRLPEVGFLGRTPAAQHFGVSLLKISGTGSNGNRPYILHTSSEPLKIPFFISPGLRLCHQLKSFDRPGQQMTDCDNFALLQMRPSSSPSFDNSIASTSTANTLLPYSASSANAHYHLRLPVSAFYYLTIYAAFEETGTIATETSGHLECVYRILVDARRPTVASGTGLVPSFPKQTYWWVGARLLEPTRLNLDVNKRHLFRLDVPAKYVSVAVVINASEWHFLTSTSTSNSNSSTNSIRWSGKVTPTVTGELAVYASTKPESSVTETSEGVPYVKLLEGMEFKINEEFAKHYNEYRQKEELMKLKSKYGDVKLKKKPVNEGEDGSEGSDVESDSSSSSSESESEWEDQEQEDFLRLYDALCRNDPALNDEEKVWFKVKSEDEEEEKINKKGKIKPVLLKDHVRELLLDEGEDDIPTAAPKDSKLDPKALKEAFLAETEKLFEDGDDDMFARKTPKPKSDKPKKPPVDTSHFTFGVSQEDEEFLRDYLVNRRWKAAEKKLHQQKTAQQYNEPDPDEMVEEVLANKKKQAAKVLDQPLLTTPEELEEDDDFLVKARRFEDAWNNNDEELEKQYPATTASRYRFEEDDKEFIKTYPRKIDDTLRQPSGKAMTRAEKRKARAERKAAEKARKIADIERLKRLKMAEFAEKLERIRKTCGDGFAMETKIDTDTGKADDAYVNEVREEMIDCLDTDWDPEAHDRLVAKLFNDDYYGASTADDALDEAPKVESDEEDAAFMQTLDTGDYDDYLPRQHACVGSVNGDEDSSKLEKKSSKGGAEDEMETSALVRAAKEIYSTLVPRKRGKKARGRSLLRTALDREKPTYDPRQHPDFEKYFSEFYQLDCEDIISGSGPGDDIFCRFKYRQVKPNDFGLTVEEILKADEKELNRWVPVKTMCAYRTEEEEERDLRRFHSVKVLRKKTELIPSLLKNENEEGKEKPTDSEKVETEEDKEKRLSKKALKRLRKKQRKAELFSAMVTAEREVNQSQALPKVKEVGKPHPEEGKSVALSEVREKREEVKRPAKGQESRPTRKRKLGIAEAGNKDSAVEEAKPERKKSKHHQSQQSKKNPKLSDERLKAAGIDLKSYKYMKMTGKM